MDGRQDRDTPAAERSDDDGFVDSTRALTIAERRGASEPEGAGEPGAAPWSVGRYLVIDEIGVGGMGRVYRAYDPKLSREVAVKCLKIRGSTGSMGSARMLREAKAMAQLAHPNVVPIYDVDAEDGSLFLAMEYVQGATLREWLARERDWRAIVEVFVDAGRGLAAAHAQGIVHRDFKPANVIVGADGRARVMDFGLARSIDASARDAGESVQDFEPASATTGVDLGRSLTEHGTVMGTPRYMAPEQHGGDRIADARSDQYAFCTALWEALYGSGPFAARSITELAAAKTRPPAKPPASAVPSAVHAIVARGLDPEPQSRWPDMDTLLTALGRTTARRRSWWLALPLVAAGGLAAFAVAARESPCTEGAEAIAAAWNDDARARVEAAITGTGIGYAASTWQRVATGLDRQAADWGEMHRDACEATKVRHEQSDEALDLRMACLGERRAELAAVVELLGRADAGVVEHAIEIVGGITPLSRCADVQTLRQRVPPPDRADVIETVDRVRAQLVEAAAHERAGRIDEALAMTTAASDLAATTDYAPIVAEAEARLGTLLSTTGKMDAAEPLLEHALDVALTHGMDHVAAETAIELGGLVDSGRARPSEATWLTRVALGLAQSEGTDVVLVAHAMLGVGSNLQALERKNDAEPYIRGAVELLERELGPDRPELGPALSHWAVTLRMLDRRDEAVAVAERAVRLAETAYGPDHPATASALEELAYVLSSNDRFADAEVAYDRAIAVNEAAFGPNHPAVRAGLNSRVGALAEQGKFDAAIASLQEAQRRMDDVPPVHPARANNLHNLAMVHATKGDGAKAVELFEQATAMRRELGMQHDLGTGLSEMGRALVELGRYEQAREAFEECDRIFAALQAEGGLRTGVCQVELGKLALREGDPKRALAHLEPVVELQRGSKNPLARAEATFALGQALWESGGDRKRARELLEYALAEVTKKDSSTGRLRAAVMQAWWEAHAR